MSKQIKPWPVFLILALLLALPAAGCQPGGSQSTVTPEPSESPPVFEHEVHVRIPAEEPTDLEPGLYCLTALNGDGLFHLLAADRNQTDPVRVQAFRQRAWVEVRQGEILRYKGAKVETEEEREMQGCYPVTLRDGFFRIGLDIFPGMLTVTGGQADGETPVCEIYASAHDLAGGPLRTYELKDSLNYIQVSEGEYLYLWGAEAYIPPT